MTGAAFAGDVRELGAVLELLAQVAPLLATELTIARDEEDEPRIDDRSPEGIARDAAEVRCEEVMSHKRSLPSSPSISAVRCAQGKKFAPPLVAR
jgi:hypothetical protein